MRRICIIGSAPSTRNEVNYDDDTLEFWTLMQRKEKKSDRVFEIHCVEMIKKSLEEYHEIYNTYKNQPPVYAVDDIGFDNMVKYPLSQAIDFITSHGGNKDYIMSSIGYMIILAILERADEILVYGVDMKSDDEYAYQKSNCEWLLGIASGMGIKVTIPEKSSLLKSRFRYGTIESVVVNKTGDLSVDNLLLRREEHIKELRTVDDNLLSLKGSFNAVGYLLTNDDINRELLLDNLKKIEETFRAQETQRVIKQGIIAECEVMIDLARNEKLGGV